MKHRTTIVASVAAAITIITLALTDSAQDNWRQASDALVKAIVERDAIIDKQNDEIRRQYLEILRLTQVIADLTADDDGPDDPDSPPDFSGQVDITLAAGITYEIHQTITAADITISSADPQKPGVLKWAGDQTGTMIDMTGGALKDVILTSVYPSAKGQAPRLVQLNGTGAVITGCRFSNCDDAINANGSPQAAIISDNSFGVTGGYAIWLAGRDHTVSGNTFMASLSEHTLRTSNDAENYAIASNAIEAGGQKHSAIWSRGDNATIYNNVIAGQVTIGPNEAASDSSVAEVSIGHIVSGNLIAAPEGGIALTVTSGCQHGRIEHNTLRADAGTGIRFSKWEGAAARIARDLTVINNTITNSRSSGRAIELRIIPTATSFSANTYRAPELTTGSHRTANVYAQADELTGVTFTGNTWQIPKKIGWGNGLHYLWPSWSNAAGYRSVDEWNNLPQTSGELYAE